MAVAIQTKKRSFTEDELMRLPRDGRKWELVDGDLKQVPTNFEHDTIVMHLGIMLHPHVKGKGFLTGSQAGFWMAGGNLRCPDVGFTRKERVPGGRPPKTFGAVSPDLCIEIISPSEERTDMRRKVEEYFASGAEQVWHMFPETQTLTVYTSPTEAAGYGPADEIEGGDLLSGFRCQVLELFEVE